MPEVFVSKKVVKQLKDLKDTNYHKSIKEFIYKLQQDQFPKGYDIARVKGKQIIRVRFGQYRLFYEIKKKENRIEVITLLPRKITYTNFIY